ncbi:unnamed protein product [Meganyctiphanes norvegica]|uniref:G-protein coupled receptors family 1 profile domain-containing protein n=1 Tax=Meganyctiphanes norvegica TaxID=48144 RepID=A0AAV2RMR7_MEGNR
MGMLVTSVVSVLGSIGNALTMCTIIHQSCWLPPRMRSIPKLTADTVLIFNLALTDFLYCILALPPLVATYYCIYSNENCTWLSATMDKFTLCKISAFVRHFIADCECMTLGVMALERCVAIYRFRHRRYQSSFFTPINTAGICLLLWLISMVALSNLFHNNYGYNEKTFKCDYLKNSSYNETTFKFDYSNNSTCTPGWSNLVSPRGDFFFFKFIIFIIFIVMGYFVILYQIYFSGGSNKHISMAIRRFQSTKVIRRLLFVYIICILPMCIFNIIQTYRCFNPKYIELNIVLYCIYFIQYFANNFIYALGNKKYRYAYKQFYAFVCCSEMPVPMQRAFPLQDDQASSICSTESPNPDTASLASDKTSTSSMT